MNSFLFNNYATRSTAAPSRAHRTRDSSRSAAVPDTLDDEIAGPSGITPLIASDIRYILCNNLLMKVD